MSVYGHYPEGTQVSRQLLPFLDPALDALIRDAAMSGQSVGTPRRLDVYVCPSDDFSGRLADVINYAANMGTGNQAFGFNGFFGASHWIPEGYPSHTPGPLTRPADMVDGLSNTIAASEFLVFGGGDDPNDYRRGFWRLNAAQVRANEIAAVALECDRFRSALPSAARDQGSRGVGWSISFGYTMATYHHMLPPNSPSCFNGGSTYGIYSASSRHPGSVHSLFGDGRAVTVGESIDLEIWKSYGARDDAAARHSLAFY